MTLAEAQVDLFDCEHMTPPPAPEGIPYIAIPEMKEGRLDVSKARLVAPSQVPIWNRRVTPSAGDVILSRRTNPGTTAVVPPRFPCVLGQNLVILRSRGTKVYQGFLRWAVRGPEWWQQIEKFINVGAVFDSLRCADVPKFELTFPPLPEQRAIAGILGALDDKIELNRRMNQSLEAIARALFKSWFVDFDPVRAKMRGEKPTGMDAATAALFPNRLVTSEIGEVPEGWATSTIGAFCEVVDCLHAKKPEPQATGRPMLQLNNILDDGLMDLADIFWISEADYALWTSRMEAREGDCVITNVGRVAAAAQVPAGFKAALGRNMTGLRLKAGNPYPSFLVECLLSDVMKDEILTKVDTGTILDALNVRNIPKLRMVLAPHAVMAAFERRCRPLRRAMDANLEQARTLAGLRDSLLPKLLSGKIRVPLEQEVPA